MKQLLTFLLIMLMTVGCKLKLDGVYTVNEIYESRESPFKKFDGDFEVFTRNDSILIFIDSKNNAFQNKKSEFFIYNKGRNFYDVSYNHKKTDFIMEEADIHYLYNFNYRITLDNKLLKISTINKDTIFSNISHYKLVK